MVERVLETPTDLNRSHRQGCLNQINVTFYCIKLLHKSFQDSIVIIAATTSYRGSYESYQ